MNIKEKNFNCIYQQVLISSLLILCIVLNYMPLCNIAKAEKAPDDDMFFANAIPISTPKELASIRDYPERNYYLTDDIVFEESDFTNIGDFPGGFSGIYVFHGIFDGCGHKIVGLYDGDYDYHCYRMLFGSNYGIIKNVELKNSEFGLCEENYGTIRNCKITNCNIDGFAPEGCELVSYNYGNVEYCSARDDSMDFGGYTAICYANYSGAVIQNCVNYKSGSYHAGICYYNGGKVQN